MTRSEEAIWEDERCSFCQIWGGTVPNARAEMDQRVCTGKSVPDTDTCVLA